MNLCHPLATYASLLCSTSLRACCNGLSMSLGGRLGGRPPWPGRLSCHSMMLAGRHAGVRPNVRSGAGIWPRALYVDTVLIETPRYAATSEVTHQSVVGSGSGMASTLPVVHDAP